MVFNSIDFLIFFPTVVALYYALPHRWRWSLLLTASCIFYMRFIPIYILILAFTIVVDYFAGLWIAGAQGKWRKIALTTSIVANVGVLAVFKYYNFFAANINDVARVIDWNYSLQFLRIALPIGLSFHTFQAMSYTIEVYRGRVEPERHFGIYALYVMFFPQLVAGPIERPQQLLHQFHKKVDFDYRGVTDGLKLMAWGFFKKVVIADRLAPVVNTVYNHPNDYSASILFVATILFAFQIYCDFAGYSDIALGSAQVLGIRLMTNFRRPYCARSFRDFWRRWHISLSSWFRDYVYIPLGGNQAGTVRTAVNLFAVFTLSGLWHGANWTYVIWGALHGFYVATERILGQGRKAGEPSRLYEFAKWLTTFTFVIFAWIFFRAATIRDALHIAARMPAGVRDLFAGLAHPSVLLGQFSGLTDISILIPIVSIIIMEVVQYHQERGSVRAQVAAWPLWLRWASYYALTAWVVFFGKFEAEQFIYFQF